MLEDLFIAVIRNEKGEYFKSYSAYSGVVWTDEIKKAKVYAKMGVAKSRVTSIVTYYKRKKITNPIPIITQFTISGFIDHDQTERILLAEEKKRMFEEKSKLALALWKKEQAQKEYDRVKSELERLGRQIQKF